MEPVLGRDATVATVLIAAIVALATGSVVLGGAILAAAALAFGAGALIRARHGARSSVTRPQGH
ncbi:MAG: hypothetical protein JSS68_20570 [Actinobacteria bacterium]|nr:hypothetical protein [Actinomycetota bacterium]